MLPIKTGKLSAKGVVAIPVAVRRLLNAQPGDRLEFEVKGDEVVVRAVKRKTIWDAVGIIKIKGPLNLPVDRNLIAEDRARAYEEKLKRISEDSE